MLYTKNESLDSSLEDKVNEMFPGNNNDREDYGSGGEGSGNQPN